MKICVRAVASWLLLVAMLPALSGCVLVPFVQAFKETGVTETDRKALLGAEVKKFSDGLMWGSRTESLSVVSDEAREEISKQLSKVSEEERVVDSKVEDITWGESAMTADVALKVRFYKVPFYVVKTRIEEQKWEFTIGTGWRLKSRSIKEG